MKYLLAIFLPVILNIEMSANENSRLEVKPLLTTNWGQGYPYNVKAMEYINWDATGCTPTAIAQIMKYYNYPESGMRDISYIFDGQNIPYNLTQVRFDWDNMLDLYENEQWTAEEAEAVSELMFAISTTLPMAHTTYPFGNDPLHFCEAAALEYFFGYDECIRHIEHNYFDDETWENIIYYEISNGRPVLINGFGPNMGHSFICDGYKDGLFHFNWGWNGASDGYFSLATLMHENQSFHSNYNFNQNITIGITPKGVNNATNPFLESNQWLIIDSDFGEKFDFRIMRLTPFEFEIGLELSDTSGAIKFVKTDNLNVESRHQQTCSLTLPTSIQGLADGNYTARPVYRCSNSDWEEMPVRRDKVAYMDVTIKNGKCNFASGHNTAAYTDLFISGFTPTEENVYANTFTNFLITSKNSGTFPFYETVRLDFVNIKGDTFSTYLNFCSHHLLPAEEMVYTLYIDLPVDKYSAQFFNERTREHVSDKFDINISELGAALSTPDAQNTATPVYYNLNGEIVEAENLVPGFYIKKTAMQIEKVVIK